MKPQPITKYNPSFGILQEYKVTNYGTYTKGLYKGNRIEIYDSKRDNQKLIYVSDNKFWKWIKFKLIYFYNGVKKVRVDRADNYTE